MSVFLIQSESLISIDAICLWPGISGGDSFGSVYKSYSCISVGGSVDELLFELPLFYLTFFMSNTELCNSASLVSSLGAKR